MAPCLNVLLETGSHAGIVLLFVFPAGAGSAATTPSDQTLLEKGKQHTASQDKPSSAQQSKQVVRVPSDRVKKATAKTSKSKASTSGPGLDSKAGIRVQDYLSDFDDLTNPAAGCTEQTNEQPAASAARESSKPQGAAKGTVPRTTAPKAGTTKTTSARTTIKASVHAENIPYAPASSTAPLSTAKTAAHDSTQGNNANVHVEPSAAPPPHAQQPSDTQAKPYAHVRNGIDMVTFNVSINSVQEAAFQLPEEELQFYAGLVAGPPQNFLKQVPYANAVPRTGRKDVVLKTVFKTFAEYRDHTW